MTNWANIFTNVLFYVHVLLGYTKWERWSFDNYQTCPVPLSLETKIVIALLGYNY